MVTHREENAHPREGVLGWLLIVRSAHAGNTRAPCSAAKHRSPRLPPPPRPALGPLLLRPGQRDVGGGGWAAAAARAADRPPAGGAGGHALPARGPERRRQLRGDIPGCARANGCTVRVRIHVRVYTYARSCVYTRKCIPGTHGRARARGAPARASVRAGCVWARVCFAVCPARTVTRARARADEDGACPAHRGCPGRRGQRRRRASAPGTSGARVRGCERAGALAAGTTCVRACVREYGSSLLR